MFRDESKRVGEEIGLWEILPSVSHCSFWTELGSTAIMIPFKPPPPENHLMGKEEPSQEHSLALTGQFEFCLLLFVPKLHSIVPLRVFLHCDSPWFMRGVVAEDDEEGHKVRAIALMNLFFGSPQFSIPSIQEKATWDLEHYR